MRRERLIRKREIDVNMHNARHTQVTNHVKLLVFNVGRVFEWIDCVLFSGHVHCRCVRSPITSALRHHTNLWLRLRGTAATRTLVPRTEAPPEWRERYSQATPENDCANAAAKSALRFTNRSTSQVSQTQYYVPYNQNQMEQKPMDTSVLASRG